MATYAPAKRNTAFVFYVGLVSQADGKVLQVNPTLAAGDVKIAKDDGAPANLATLPVVDGDFTKRVKVSLSATEMDADQVTILFVDAAGAEWCDLMVNIQTVARQYDDLAYPATSGRSMVVDAAGLVDANTVKVGPTGAGAAQTAADIPARLPAALVAGRIDASVGAMAANVMTAAAAAADLTTELQAGLATAAALATVDAVVDAIQVKTDNLPTDPADESLLIAATDAIMARLGAPAGVSVSADIAAIEAQTDDIGVAGAGLTALGDARLANLDASVASRATQASVDALDALMDLEALTLVDIQSRLPPALVGGRIAANAEVVGDKVGYALTAGERAAVADKLLGRTRAGGADGGRTVAQCLAFGRNRWEIAGGVLTVYADDDLTPLFTAPVTTAPGDPVNSVTPS